MTFVVVVGLRGSVALGELDVVLDDELVEADVLVDVDLGVVDELLCSVYDLVEVRSWDEYEDVLRILEPDLLLVFAVLEDVPSARALRSFFILCAVTPARVASTGAAKMLTTDAQSIAKKQAPREGLHPRIR